MVYLHAFLCLNDIISIGLLTQHCVQEYRGHHRHKSSNTEPRCDVNGGMKTERRFTKQRPEKKTQRSDSSLKKNT